MRRQRLGAGIVGAVAGVLTALSLAHLAHGICVVTGASTWECWSMAIGIDLGFVALEVSNLTSGEVARKKVERWVRWATAGTLLGSAALNALAFGAQSEGMMVWPAALIGFAIPALIYVMTRVGTTVWLSR